MLVKGNTGLVVIDVQGNLAKQVHQSERTISNVCRMIQGAQALEMPILWLEQTPSKLGPSVDAVANLMAGKKPLAKHTFDACSSAEFLSYVKAANVRSWLICGMEAHICVYQTAQSMIKLGYYVEVVSDAVSSRDEDNKILALNKCALQRIGLTSVEMSLYEILGDCLSPEFKSILALVK